MAKPSRWIETAEESAGSGFRWFLVLAGWILLRNLLEGFLEPPHQLGFDWREDVSFRMVFLHFPIFYAAVFVGAALWLHWIGGRSLRRAAAATSLGFIVLPLAPLIDAWASGGRGHDLRYLPELGSVLWRFWDPTTALASVSTGQRVEIALACLLGGAYVAFSRRRSVWALPAMAGLFVWFAFLGAWPALFARFFAGDAASFGEAYRTIYRGAGLIADESRRLALVMLLPLGGLLPLFAWRYHRDRIRSLLGSLRWSRLLYYTGLAPAGAMLGWLVYRDVLPGMMVNPSDVLAVGGVWAAMAAAFAAATLWNEVSDLEGDRLNAPTRPLVTGRLLKPAAERWARGAAMVALFLSLCISYQAMLIMTAVLLFSWLYSCPPIRLKRWPILSTFTLGFLSLCSVAFGFSLFGQEMTPIVFPPGIAGVLLIAVPLGFTAKDLKDVSGDRATGVVTLATLLGERGGRRAAALLVAAGYALVPVLLPLGSGMLAASLLFAASGAVLTMRLRKPDTWLLVGFVLYGFLLAVGLARHPEAVRRRVPDVLRRLHGATLTIEQGVRDVRRGVDGEPMRWTERIDAALASISPASAWSERLEWARAQVSPAIESRLSPLIDRRPLRSTYREVAVAGLDPQRAIVASTAAIRLGVRPGDFLRHRAALRLASEDLGEVAHDLAGAFLFGQQEPLVWVLLGDLLARRGLHRDAEEAYARARTKAPGCADAWSGSGEVYIASGHIDQAIEVFRRAAELDPLDPWIRNNLGVALREAGDLKKAEACFREAHALAPALFEPLFNLGLTCERLGRQKEAAGWYRAAERHRPGFAPLEEALRRLRGREEGSHDPTR